MINHNGDEKILSIEQIYNISGEEYATYNRKSEKKTESQRKNWQVRIGESNVMKCGLKAEIIDYKGNKNISLLFEDGEIVHNKSYEMFRKGTIGHPNIKYTLAKKRIGETLTMKNGLKATILDYRTNADIDIEFENGKRLYNVSYAKFKKGTLRDKSISEEYREERLGEERMMNCGMKARIIKYENVRNIDIKFEDGVIRKGAMYSKFVTGSISHPNKSTAEIRKSKKK